MRLASHFFYAAAMTSVVTIAFVTRQDISLVRRLQLTQSLRLYRIQQWREGAVKTALFSGQPQKKGESSEALLEGVSRGRKNNASVSQGAARRKSIDASIKPASARRHKKTVPQDSMSEDDSSLGELEKMYYATINVEKPINEDLSSTWKERIYYTNNRTEVKSAAMNVLTEDLLRLYSDKELSPHIKEANYLNLLGMRKYRALLRMRRRIKILMQTANAMADVDPSKTMEAFRNSGSVEKQKRNAGFWALVNGLLKLTDSIARDVRLPVANGVDPVYAAIADLVMAETRDSGALYPSTPRSPSSRPQRNRSPKRDFRRGNKKRDASRFSYYVIPDDDDVMQLSMERNDAGRASRFSEALSGIINAGNRLRDLIAQMERLAKKDNGTKAWASTADYRVDLADAVVEPTVKRIAYYMLGHWKDPTIMIPDLNEQS